MRGRPLRFMIVSGSLLGGQAHEVANVLNDALEIAVSSQKRTSGDVLADGGAAMMAYAKMQFSQMSDQEREAISSALLRSCELDTFAMVMICEY